MGLAKQLFIQKGGTEEDWQDRRARIKAKWKKINGVRKAKKLKRKLRRQWQGRYMMSQGWMELRRKVFAFYGRKCMACGSTAEIEVDHIKPKSRYPELLMEPSNLQPLCGDCNRAKGTRVMDYRPKDRRLV